MKPLPADFVRNIEPSLLDVAAQRWHLTLGDPFLLSYNYVCAARTATGLDVVLKVGVPSPELLSEIEALRLYDGQGAARLLDSDPETGLLLLERLHPGTMLLEVADDARTTEIAAGVMRSLWRPAPQQSNLISFRNWFDAFWQYRQKFGLAGPLPRNIVETVSGFLTEFSSAPPVVLHGDLHHYNLLQSGANWKVIDPKGLVGPCGYEVGPFLLNPFGDLLHGPDAKQMTVRRFAILSAQLGLDRSEIRGWGIAHAALSACWDFDAHGRGGEHAIHCAEMFLAL